MNKVSLDFVAVSDGYMACTLEDAELLALRYHPTIRNFEYVEISDGNAWFEFESLQSDDYGNECWIDDGIEFDILENVKHR